MQTTNLYEAVSEILESFFSIMRSVYKILYTKTIQKQFFGFFFLNEESKLEKRKSINNTQLGNQKPHWATRFYQGYFSWMVSSQRRESGKQLRVQPHASHPQVLKHTSTSATDTTKRLTLLQHQAPPFLGLQPQGDSPTPLQCHLEEITVNSAKTE